jgi:hypothetical protein
MDLARCFCSGVDFFARDFSGLFPSSATEQKGDKISQKSANKLLCLCPIKIVIAAGPHLTVLALKVPEPCAGKGA